MELFFALCCVFLLPIITHSLMQWRSLLDTSMFLPYAVLSTSKIRKLFCREKRVKEDSVFTSHSPSGHAMSLITKFNRHNTVVACKIKFDLTTCVSCVQKYIVCSLEQLLMSYHYSYISFTVDTHKYAYLCTVRYVSMYVCVDTVQVMQ